MNQDRPKTDEWVCPIGPADWPTTRAVQRRASLYTSSDDRTWSALEADSYASGMASGTISQEYARVTLRLWMEHTQRIFQVEDAR